MWQALPEEVQGCKGTGKEHLFLAGEALVPEFPEGLHPIVDQPEEPPLQPIVPELREKFGKVHPVEVEHQHRRQGVLDQPMPTLVAFKAIVRVHVTLRLSHDMTFRPFLE